jgi:uncharacterized RDD family membrane protein YckC
MHTNPTPALPFALPDIDPDTLEQAPLGRRVVATLLDGLLRSVVVVGPSLIAFILHYAFFRTEFPERLARGIAGALHLLVWGVQGILVVARGQSIGKMLMGLQIQSDKGEALGSAGRLKAHLIREMALFVMFGCLFPLATPLAIFTLVKMVPPRQPLHDWAASTRVVLLPANRRPSMDMLMRAAGATLLVGALGFLGLCLLLCGGYVAVFLWVAKQP